MTRNKAEKTSLDRSVCASRPSPLHAYSHAEKELKEVARNIVGYARPDGGDGKFAQVEGSCRRHSVVELVSQDRAVRIDHLPGGKNRKGAVGCFEEVFFQTQGKSRIVAGGKGSGKNVHLRVVRGGLGQYRDQRFPQETAAGVDPESRQN